jgi:hypothetical protein
MSLLSFLKIAKWTLFFLFLYFLFRASLIKFFVCFIAYGVVGYFLVEEEIKN